MTEGFDVFVQLVMAAMTTEPFERSYSFPLALTATESVLFVCLSSIVCKGSGNICFDLAKGTRSCGRRGPAKLGSTADRYNWRVSLTFGSAAASVRKRP